MENDWGLTVVQAQLIERVQSLLLDLFPTTLSPLMTCSPGMGKRILKATLNASKTTVTV
jgi:hypothetical protein